MPEDQYFRPRNWGKFQSRSNNSMSWVKLQTRVNQDPEFLSLQPGCRALWLQLLGLCGQLGKPLPWHCGFLGRSLALPCNHIDRWLKQLEALHFIELCERTTNLHDELPSLEEKREDKKERKAPTEPKERTPSAQPPRRGTRLPDDWMPDEHDISYARERGFDEAAIRDIAENFRTHWTLGNGRNKTHVLWSGVGSTAWKQWVRNQRPVNGTGGNRSTDGGLAAAVRNNLIPGSA